MAKLERYSRTTINQYEKKGLLYHFCTKVCNKKIIPILKRIKNKKILDVGIGTGIYLKYIKENDVTGFDLFPHLLCGKEVNFIRGDAVNIKDFVKAGKYDIVFSSWMTEYLNKEEMRKFFDGAKHILNGNGKIIITIISKSGFGGIYTFLAGLLKNVKKYGYKEKEIINMLQSAGFTKIEIIKLNGMFNISWAYLVIAE